MRSLSVAAVAAVALTGCSSGTTVLADATPSPLPCRPDAHPIAQPDTTVASSGAEPRVRLRYRPSAPVTVRAQVSQSVVRTDTSTGTPSTTRLTARVPYTVRFSKVCGSLFTSETVYGRPRVVQAEGTATQALRQRLELLDGLVVREARDTRGRLAASSRSAPAGVDPAAQQGLDDLLGQLAQSAVVFPKQPLGVGARWTTRRQQAVSGFSLTSTARYTVTAIDADAVALDVTLDVTAPSQVHTRQGTRVALLSYRGTGSGSLRINLHTAMPSVGVIALTVDQRLDTPSSQVRNRVTQVVRLSGP